MTAITATEFKSNFKHFGNIVSMGEHLLIKRPKKEVNLIVINENEYKEMNRLVSYYKALYESTVKSEATTSNVNAEGATANKRGIIGLAKGKIQYPEDFDELNSEIENTFYNNEDDLL